MGLRNGVNQNFFILSIADALQGVMALCNSMCYILEWFELHPKAVSYFVLDGLLEIAYAFPLYVSLITMMVIALVRCCCVMMPFTVQRILTARKQLAAILFFLRAYDGCSYLCSNLRIIRVEGLRWV
ncbi:hypothetical protein ElyMa_001003900 [Elysia marginata]|uniref:G-protein coupled receptors family 1 profile domain-containing protein n=1 Tax=Elysia marginata TaxID=1093978 RepID=A0AAV4HJK3_9GAST|nr:hypothetical protein ElyMa_001003900 [Elysia marginata]